MHVFASGLFNPLDAAAKAAVVNPVALAYPLVERVENQVGKQGLQSPFRKRSETGIQLRVNLARRQRKKLCRNGASTYNVPTLFILRIPKLSIVQSDEISN